MKLIEGGDVLEQWMQEQTDPDDLDFVADALARVTDGSYRGWYRHYEDVTRRLQEIVEPRLGLVIVLRFYLEYPSGFGIVYIGPPDDYL